MDSNVQSEGTRTPERLRELASRYRRFAERAGSTVIWESRLRMADDLDHEARTLSRVKAGE